MARKSIFEFERRFDFDVEYEALFDLLNSLNFKNPKSKKKLYFFDVVKLSFDFWPYNAGAINIDHYFKRLDIEDSIEFEDDNENRLYIIDFIINYINWLENNYFNDYNNLEDLEYIKMNFNTISNLINQILECLNFSVSKGTKHLYITKRDENLDSILNIIKEPSIRELMLSFSDFRIENNFEEKKLILKQLGDYLEPNRTKYSSYDSQLTNDIFTLLNILKIRHNDRKQMQFEKKEQYLEWYDKLFKMIIHLLRTEEIIKIKREVKILKS